MLSNIGIKLFLLARTGDLIQRHKISENPSVGIKLRIVRSLAFITFIPTYCAIQFVYKGMNWKMREQVKSKFLIIFKNISIGTNNIILEKLTSKITKLYAPLILFHGTQPMPIDPKKNLNFWIFIRIELQSLWTGFSNHLNNLNFFELVRIHEKPGEDEHHEHGKDEHWFRHVRIWQLNTQTCHHVRKLEQTIPNRFAHRLYILRHELRQHWPGHDLETCGRHQIQ